jgi:hypothetical protein
MALPYGAIAAAGGLGSLFFGAAALGWQVAGAGAAVLASAALSLRAWKGGGSSLPYTLVSAGACVEGGRPRRVAVGCLGRKTDHLSGCGPCRSRACLSSVYTHARARTLSPSRFSKHPHNRR